MYLRYFRSVPNWGDMISPYLFEKISGSRPIALDSRQTSPNGESVYQVTGSIMGWCCSKTEVWGSGFMTRAPTRINRPRKVHAVRGPLTQKLLSSMGIDCPELYGDPGLLMPIFYRPTIEARYEFGIIPHYLDAQHPWVHSLQRREDVKVINIMRGTEAFVDDLLSCKLIISSSLHGLIAADAYGIPTIHAILTDRITGGNFKFDDYYQSVGVEHQFVRINRLTPIADVAAKARLITPKINVKKLFDACPFIRHSASVLGGVQ